MELNTFSIVARSIDGQSFGVAVSTARPVVGSLVPFVSLRGAIATQARVNTDLGRKGLKMISADIDIKTTLESLLKTDNDQERRQVHGLDAGLVFAYTGEACVQWAGHFTGSDYSVAGNMLRGPEVTEAMAETFEQSENLEFSERLLRALEAGQNAGGDKRGKQSAALLIASPEPRLYHNLRVDDSADPVRELRRIYELVLKHSKIIEQEYGQEGLRLFSRVKTC